MIITILSILLGFIFLIKGSDLLVSGASALAKRMGVSEMMVGLTVVAFGTSLPELVINVSSALFGSTDVAFGNIMGSNIANTLLILGLAATVVPLHMSRHTSFREIPFAVFSAVILLLLGLDGVINILDGGILLVLLCMFIMYTFMRTRENEYDLSGESVSQIFSRWRMVAMMIGGLALLIGGGVLVVESAVLIASQIGMSESLIGLTIVALGTSLPELVSTLVAVRRGNTNMALGNIIGSNIFNVLGILGITAILQKVSIPAGGMLDLWVMTGGMVILFIFVITGTRHHITRGQGLLLVGGYALYMVVRIMMS